MNKIKILHISPDFNYSCGVSRYINDLCNHYSADRKYELFFITNRGNSLSRLKKIKVTIKIMKFSRGFINIIYFLPNLITLFYFCYKNKINIIHTHHRYPELLAVITGKILKIKTITTVHSLLKGYRRLSFKSDHIIAVSNAVFLLLTDFFKVPAEKINTILNGVETSNFQQNIDIKVFKQEMNIPPDLKILLFLGRITALKGVDILIKSFEKISIQKKDLLLLIIGDFYDNSLDKCIKDLPSNIKIIPAVENPYLFYFTSEAVILPSLIESLPYIMLESGLMRKPFIGSRTGGIAEFIEDGENGLLFEPGNTDQLAEKINYVLDNPEKSKLLGENLYKKVTSECSSEYYFKKLDEIYNDLVK